MENMYYRIAIVKKNPAAFPETLNANWLNASLLAAYFNMGRNCLNMAV